MSDHTITPNQNVTSPPTLQFGEEVYLEQAGFSFRPILGFELEVDGSVYMYSDDGNLEISLIGGELDNKTTIAELNDKLAADFMENFDEFSLIEAGKDTIQGITGFLNKIQFLNAEEEGIGRAVICSPHFNQFFFLLVISSAEYWDQIGDKVFSEIKPHIHFHAQFKPVTVITRNDEHPDLTIEMFESVISEAEIAISIEKDDLSLLMAARSTVKNDEISITEIRAPGGQFLYQYNPTSGEFSSIISNHPLTSKHGEIGIYLPTSNHASLNSGDYHFSFATNSGLPLYETQVIIRHKHATSPQKLDFNLWIALEDDRFNDQVYVTQFQSKLRERLTELLAPLKITPGSFGCFHPAPDELATFSSVNLDSDLADCSYMISEYVENNRALNIGLVGQITQGDPPVDAAVNAISSGSPGMILSIGSPKSCILINYAAFEDDFSALAKAIIEQLVIFSGVKTDHIIPQSSDQKQDKSLGLTQEEVVQLRSHPIIYADS